MLANWTHVIICQIFGVPVDWVSFVGAKGDPSKGHLAVLQAGPVELSIVGQVKLSPWLKHT